MARTHECYVVWLKGALTGDIFPTRAEADVFFNANKANVHRYCYEALVAHYEDNKVLFEVKSETQIYPPPG